MEWFKLYHEARRDKKLSLLTLAERGVWVNLLCYASEQVERGTFDASDRFTLALECADGDESILNSAIEKLLKVRCLITVDGTHGLLTFRMFAERQTRKASNFPSDAPDRVKARVDKYRGKGNGTTDNDSVTSVTSRNDTEVEGEGDGESESPSGNSGNNPSVVAEASTAAKPPPPKVVRPSDDEWRRTAQNTAIRLKLSPAKVSDLLALFEQCPHNPKYFELETGKYLEWCEENDKRPSLRHFSNWLVRAEENRQQQKQTTANRARQNGRTRPADAAPVYTSVEDSVAKVWGEQTTKRSAS